MEPWGRNGIDLQRFERHSAEHLVEVGRKQRIQHLPQAVIMQRHALQACLEQGEHPAFLETGSYLIQGMVSVKDREHQRLYPVPTGEHMGRMGWNQAIDDCGGVEAPQHP